LRANACRVLKSKHQFDKTMRVIGGKGNGNFVRLAHSRDGVPTPEQMVALLGDSFCLGHAGDLISRSSAPDRNASTHS
jgi:hypothetical protein